jgi:hypothetical protein
MNAQVAVSGMPDALPTGWETSAYWLSAIREARAEPNDVLANLEITHLHSVLSRALARVLAADAGPNFHTWAVWGSRKAGVTIRQEDLDTAIRDATHVSGIVGAAVGGAAGAIVRDWLGAGPQALAAALGAALGALCGGLTGRAIAVWSRGAASRLVLEGNRTVLEDIGAQTARFIEAFASVSGGDGAALERFLSGLRPGPTETGGQDRLAAAFRQYHAARAAGDPALRRQAMVAANQQIVYHEHVRLTPYIRGAMPFIVRRCATQRLMTFEVGERVLTVGADVPGGYAGTAARDWADIRDRMRYVFALFDEFHDDPVVWSAPFPAAETAAIAAGRLPSRYATTPTI